MQRLFCGIGYCIQTTLKLDCTLTSPSPLNSILHSNGRSADAAALSKLAMLRGALAQKTGYYYPCVKLGTFDTTPEIV